MKYNIFTPPAEESEEIFDKTEGQIVADDIQAFVNAGIECLRLDPWMFKDGFEELVKQIKEN